ncbi:MAG: DUF1878 domain-containing protein [Firmicutes bacterium]|nr:DUF1878 domain-containing protein [Bacillota bacterium]
MELNERLDFIEFRQELLFNNTEVDRILFEYNITRDQYNEIMDLMEEYRRAIRADEDSISHGEFEQRIYDIVDHIRGNYHFCEYLTRAFKKERRWEEVFDKLYGDMPKYKGIE